VTTPQVDLLISAGRVFCADTGLDGPGSVAVKGDRIVASGPDVSVQASQTLEFPDAVLLPGLIDLHAHPAPLGSYAGIDPDTYILARGTTTVLSQGDAGADTWPGYRDTVIAPTRLRIRMAISPVSQGAFAQTGRFEDLDNIDVDACVSTIRDGGDTIWGISVNTAVQVAGESDPREIMRRVLAAANATGRPLLFGSRREPSDWPLAEQLALLRPGDALTYCLHRGTDSGDESIVKDGRVVDAVWEARERGVLFDMGHGMNSFDFGVVEAAIAEGFMPDTISTDIQRRHMGLEPPHDMPLVMSKLIAAGMPEPEVLARATLHPARALGMSDEIGTLAPGACADLAVLRWDPDETPLVDSVRASRLGGRFEPVLTVRGGETIS
jgi:dihydroorotase